MYEDKYGSLKNILEEMGSAAIAFSAGVDSTFLLKTAHEVLAGKCIAITARAPFFPEKETMEAEQFCSENGIRQIFFEPDNMQDEEFLRNPKDRCYHCKKKLFSKMLDIAEEHGFAWLAEGSNADDPMDHRPGLRAIQELGIRSPLMEAGLSKKEIRHLSEKLGLKTYNKSSMACLASRIPYGEEITGEKLFRIGKAEELLYGLGFEGIRVRSHGGIARIETGTEDLSRVVKEDMRKKITEGFKELGFDYVTLDLLGFRSGSMNEVLKNEGHEHK